MYVALRPTKETVDIVAGLGGRWHGNFAMCRCPAHTDKSPSLSIRQGNKGLLVHCFAGCRSEDILREIARFRPISNSPRPEYSHSRTRLFARNIWEQGRAVGQSLAATYLRSRNLPTDLEDIRFHPNCPFGRKPHTVFRPALLVALRQGMTIKAIQRIALKPSGKGHDGKFMLGHPQMAAWAPRFHGSILALAESMEDAAAYTRLHGTACWSPLGAERLALIRIPDHIEHLIIAEDNDRAGRRGAIAAIEAHHRQGLLITRHPPSTASDWAEVNAKRRI